MNCARNVAALVEGAMSFEVIACQLLHFGPHATIKGRLTGMVRVRIRERFMGNVTEYGLNLPVKADCGLVRHEEARTALLTHAAHQLNRLKARHSEHTRAAAE